MYISSLFFLAATALAAPLVERDATSIVSAVTTIESRITTLNNTLNTFSDNPLTGIPTVLKIEEQVAELGDAVNAATDAAKKSASLDNTDSGTVAISVLNLVPKISTLLSNIVAHKPAFDHVILGVGSVSPQVESDLKTQYGYSKDFASALVKKLTPAYAALAPSITKQIDAAFESAIKAFATSGGLFALPAVKGLGAFEEELQKYL